MWKGIKAHSLGRRIMKKTIELFYRDGNNDKERHFCVIHIQFNFRIHESAFEVDCEP